MPPHSPDGRMHIRRDGENGVLLFEIASRNVRLRLNGHRGDTICQAFSNDGRLLVTGSKDCTAIVWDVTGRRKNGDLEVIKLTDAERDRAWLQLSGPDAAVAYQGLWTLAAAGDAAVPFIKSQLTRRRIMEVLAKLPRETGYSPEVRDVRAVELLEQIGTAEARKLLEELARGPAELRLTKEAVESAKRLAARK